MKHTTFRHSLAGTEPRRGGIITAGIFALLFLIIIIFGSFGLFYNNKANNAEKRLAEMSKKFDPLKSENETLKLRVASLNDQLKTANKNVEAAQINIKALKDAAAAQAAPTPAPAATATAAPMRLPSSALGLPQPGAANVPKPSGTRIELPGADSLIAEITTTAKTDEVLKIVNEPTAKADSAEPAPKKAASKDSDAEVAKAKKESTTSTKKSSDKDDEKPVKKSASSGKSSASSSASTKKSSSQRSSQSAPQQPRRGSNIVSFYDIAQ